jgi:ribokinase
MPQQKIAVVGGVVMDLIFEVPIWPQIGEAVQGSLSNQPGGKGLNEAVACARLDAQVSIISAIGEDSYGQRLSEILQQEHIQTFIKIVHRQDDVGTDVTAVILKDGRPGFVGCRRATNDLTVDFIEKHMAVIERADVVLITFDVSSDALQRAIEIAKAAHKPIIIHAAPPLNLLLSTVNHVDCLVLNSWEAHKWLELVGLPFTQQMTDEQVGEYLLRQGVQTVIITEGSEGCLVVTTGRVNHYRPFRAKVLDATGASDAFCAGLAIAFASREPSLDRIRFASAAAALACEKLGAYNSMPRLSEVKCFLLDRQSERLN